MSCEFTVAVVGAQSVISSNSAFVASISSGNRVTIRSSQSWEVTHIFQCVDKIDKIEISPDSCYLLCALLSRNVIQVFSLEDKDWKCRINEGVAGIIDAYWTPDSRNVVAESDFGIQLSLWSLTDSNSVIVNLPKPPYTPFSKTSAFSDCGRFFAVVHRIELQDQIGVYTVSSQTSLGMGEISKFRARSNDVAAVYWVPSGTHIITLDSPLTFRFCAYTPMGECLANFEAYQNALGIRCLGLCKPFLPQSSVPPSPASTASTQADNSKFLAIGAFDGKVRLISAYSWQVAFVLPLTHPREMEAGFNSQDLQLTVEVSAVHNATILSRLAAPEEAEEGVEDTSAAGTAASAASLRQKQVPPLQQQVRCAYQRRRYNATAEEDNQAEEQQSAEQDAAERQEQEERQRESELESYFALRNLKALPRAQPFILDTKRAAAGGTAKAAASTTAKRTTGTTGGAASGSSSGGLVSSMGAGFPAVGVSWVGWSSTGQLLAAREEAHPRCMWVWSPLQARLLAVLVTLEAISCARWRPPVRAPAAAAAEGSLVEQFTAPTSTAFPPAPPVLIVGAATSVAAGEVLAFCTGTEKVYFWSPSTGVTFTDMGQLSSGRHGTQSLGNSGAVFAVMSLRWAKDGRSLILKGKESHCMCQVHF